METLQPEKVIFENEDFKFSFSQVYDMALLHCNVYNFTPSVLKEMYRALGNFLDTKEQLGINKVATLTSNPKFVELFGAVYVNTVDTNGMKLELYQWE